MSNHFVIPMVAINGISDRELGALVKHYANQCDSREATITFRSLAGPFDKVKEDDVGDFNICEYCAYYEPHKDSQYGWCHDTAYFGKAYPQFDCDRFAGKEDKNDPTV